MLIRALTRPTIAWDQRKGFLPPFQQHFGESTYFKSMIESKEKIFAQILKMAPANVDTEELELTWRQVKERFQVSVCGCFPRRVEPCLWLLWSRTKDDLCSLPTLVGNPQAPIKFHIDCLLFAVKANTGNGS